MPAVRRKKPFAIDFHSHINLEAVHQAVGGLTLPEGTDPMVVNAFEKRKGHLRDFDSPVRNDYKARIKAIDKLGFDLQQVSVNLGSAYYYADPQQALEIARIANDGIADFVSKAPDRFMGMASVPVQDPQLAGRELERAVKQLGLKGAWILTHPGGRELGEEHFRPFWEKCIALDVPVVVHPDDFPGVERLEKFGMRNAIGRPLEEGVTMASMIYGGVMDAYPKLKISICHGGGLLPYYIGRHEYNYDNNREYYRKLIKKRPTAYLKTFYYDTVVFDRDNLRTLFNKAGKEKIFLGSDFPHAVPDPVGFVQGSDLPKEAKEHILWRNAAKMLKLEI